MGYRGGKVCALEECGSIITHEQAKLWTAAYAEVVARIRASKSIRAQDDPGTFRWALHRSPTTPRRAGNTVLYLEVPSIRLVAEKGQLRRISKLYSKGKVVPGLWSF